MKVDKNPSRLFRLDHHPIDIEDALDETTPHRPPRWSGLVETFGVVGLVMAVGFLSALIESCF